MALPGDGYTDGAQPVVPELGGVANIHSAVTVQVEEKWILASAERFTEGRCVGDVHESVPVNVVGMVSHPDHHGSFHLWADGSQAQRDLGLLAGLDRRVEADDVSAVAYAVDTHHRWGTGRIARELDGGVEKLGFDNQVYRDFA